MAMPFDPRGSGIEARRTRRTRRTRRKETRRARRARRARSTRWTRRNKRVAVKRLELPQVDLLDVAADAPFAERQRHPRFEAGDHPRLHLGVLVQVVVEPVGIGVHQGLEPLRALAVQSPHLRRVDEQLHAQVAIDRGLTLGFGQPAHRVQVIGLDPVEVVLGLRIHHAEYRVGVGLAVDVRDAPVVPDDGDALGAPLPARDVGVCRLIGGGLAST